MPLSFHLSGETSLRLLSRFPFPPRSFMAFCSLFWRSVLSPFSYESTRSAPSLFLPSELSCSLLPISSDDPT